MRYTEEQMQLIDIGNRIQCRRKELGLTQEVAAERCDVTVSFYGNIERGTRAMSIQTLIKICKGLECTPDYVLFRLKNKPDIDFAIDAVKEMNLTDEDVNKFLCLIDIINKFILNIN